MKTASELYYEFGSKREIPKTATEVFMLTEYEFTKAIEEWDKQQVSVDANENPYEELFWQMLRYLEVHTKPEDILIRRDIEDGYKLWNKLHNTNMEPRWRKGLD